MKKRLISMILCICLVLALLPAASAEETTGYLALGDSITAGYGLSSEEKGFVDLLAENNGWETTNAGVSGSTASDLIGALMTGSYNDIIAGKNIVTITIGGNDMMALLYAQVAETYNAANDPDITPEELVSIMAGGTDPRMMSLLTAAQSVITGNAAMGIPAFSESPAFDAALEQFTAALNAIVTYIRALAPDAAIIVTTQYNPYKSFSGLYTVLSTGIGAGAAKLSQAIADNAAAGGYLAANVYAAFEASEGNLCNAAMSPLNLDFHPNAAGHAVIAACIQSVIDGSSEDTRVCPSAAFTDVDTAQWYHEAVDTVVTLGLMSGISNDMFNPMGQTERSMIVSILYRLEGTPDTAGTNAFDDVAENAWYTNAVLWAAEHKIVSGYGNGKFGPSDPITREQLAVILWNYAKYKGLDVSVGESTNLLSYNDAEDIAEYAIPALQWAVGAGLISGKPGGLLDPTGGASRAEAAAVLMRYTAALTQ